MQIGDITCSLIHTGYFALDGGAMFGMVPKVVWEKEFPPSETNQITLAMWALLVEAGDRLVLIDTGMGGKLPRKWQKIFQVDHSEHTLTDSLLAAGCAQESITDVILTHCHIDHAGGAISADDGEVEPTFPNARYHVQKRNWDNAMNPLPLESVGYNRQDFAPLEEWGLLQLHDGDGEILPGISALCSDGHTVGHQSLVIGVGKDALLFAGDLVPIASHCKLDYSMGYDTNARALCQDKARILARAATEEWTVLFCHDSRMAAGCVMQREGDFHCDTEVVI